LDELIVNPNPNFPTGLLLHTLTNNVSLTQLSSSLLDESQLEWFYPVRHAVFFAHHARDRRSVMSDATEEGAAHHRPGRKRVAFFQFCDPFAGGSFYVGIVTNEVECDLERYLFIFHP
jgi:hypothetical protein